MDWRCNLTLNEYNVHGDLLSSRSSSVEHARPQGLYSRYSTFTSKTHSMTENGFHKAHRKHFQHLRPFSMLAPLDGHVLHGSHDKSFLHAHTSNFRMHHHPRHGTFNGKPGRWCAVHGKIAWNIHFKKQMRRQIEPKFYTFHQNISHKYRDFNHVVSTHFNTFFSTNDHRGCFQLKPLLADKRHGRRHSEYRRTASYQGQHFKHWHSDKSMPNLTGLQRESVYEQFGKNGKSSDGMTGQNPLHKPQHSHRTAMLANHKTITPVSHQKLYESSFHQPGMTGESINGGRRRSSLVPHPPPPLISFDDIKKEPECDYNFHSLFEHIGAVSQSNDKNSVNFNGNGKNNTNGHIFNGNYSSNNNNININGNNSTNSRKSPSIPDESESSASADDKDQEAGRSTSGDAGVQRSDCRDRINFNCQSLDHVSAFSIVNHSLLDLERKTQSSSSDSSTMSCFESFKSKLDTRYVKNFQTISNLLPEPGGGGGGGRGGGGRGIDPVSPPPASRMSRRASPIKRNSYGKKCRKVSVDVAFDSRFCHKMDIMPSKADDFLAIGRFDVIGRGVMNGGSGSSSSENKNAVDCPKGSAGSESSWSSDLSGQSNNRSESEGNSSSGSLSSNESPIMDAEEKHAPLRKGTKLHR